MIIKKEKSWKKQRRSCSKLNNQNSGDNSRVIKFFDGLPKTMRGKFEGLVPKTSNSLMVKSDGLI